MNQREIPYFAFEAVLSRFERTIRRLWILLIILVVLLVGSNIAWLVYESQFETVSIEQDVQQEATAENGNAITSNAGVTYGESDATRTD